MVNSMFGQIRHFSAPGSTFNHAQGNQYNFSHPPPQGAHPGQMPDRAATVPSPDPQCQRSPGPPQRAATSSMFGDIERFDAPDSVFNSAMGDQVNYGRHPGRGPYQPVPPYYR